MLTIAEKKLGQNDTNVIAKIAVNQIHHCCDQRGRGLRITGRLLFMACCVFPALLELASSRED